MATQIPAIEEFVLTQEDHRQQLAIELAKSLLKTYKAAFVQGSPDFVDMLIVGTLDAANPTSLHHAAWMCEEIISQGTSWPSTRLHRWIGFVQAVFMMNSLVTLDDEMDRVRELKREYPED